MIVAPVEDAAPERWPTLVAQVAALPLLTASLILASADFDWSAALGPAETASVASLSAVPAAALIRTTWAVGRTASRRRTSA